jgi:glycosyl transferase family 2
MPNRPVQSLAVAMVRNCEDIIVFSVLHHLLLGVGHCVVIDNGSSDGTFELLTILARKLPRLAVLSEPATVPQQDVVNRTVNEFTRREATMVIPFDADELWDAPMRRLARAFRRTRANVLYCPMHNFVQSRSVATPTRFSWLRAYRRARRIEGSGMREAVERKVSFVEIAHPSKVLFHAHGEVAVNHGAHDVALADKVIAGSPELPVLHLPLRSRRELDKRVYDYEARFAPLRSYEEETWQGPYFRAALDRGEQELEWRANSYDRFGRMDVFGQQRRTRLDFRLVEYLARAYLYSRYLRVPASAAELPT